MSQSEGQIKTINVFCIDCSQKIKDIPKNRVTFNFIRCKQCYQKSVTFICNYDGCGKKINKNGMFCDRHRIKSKAEKKAALAKLSEEQSKPKTDDFYNDNDQSDIPQSASFRMGIDLFEIQAMFCLPSNFTETMLRTSYKQKAVELHPDKNTTNTTDQFQYMQIIYNQAISLLEANK